MPVIYNYVVYYIIMYYPGLNVIRRILDEHYVRISYYGELTIYGQKKLLMIKWRKKSSKMYFVVTSYLFLKQTT